MSTDGKEPVVGQKSETIASQEQLFLDSLTKAVKLKQTFDGLKQKQDAALERARAEIDKKRDAMRDAWMFSTVESKGGKLDKFRDMLPFQSDTEETAAIDEQGQWKSLESRNITQSMELKDNSGKIIDPNQGEAYRKKTSETKFSDQTTKPNEDKAQTIEGRAKQVMDDVLRLVEQLRAELPEPTEPNVTKDDVIRRELIEPLVRENLLVDTFLTADLSVTQQFIEGTLKTYQDEVQQNIENEERKESKQLLKIMQGGKDGAKAWTKQKLEGVSEMLEDPNTRRAMDAAKLTMKVALAGIAINGAIAAGGTQQGSSQQPAKADPVKATTKFGMAAYQGANQAYKANELNEKGEKERVKDTRKALEDRMARGASAEIINDLAMNLTDVLATIDPETAVAAGIAFRSAVSPNQLTEDLLELPPKVAHAKQILAEGYPKALSLCCPKDAIIEKAGKAFQDAFLSRVDDTLIQKSIDDGKPEEAIASLIKDTAWASKLLTNEFQDQFKKKKDEIANEVNKLTEKEEFDQLRKSQEENEEFRRKLTFIDATGEEIADEHTILMVIEKLQKKIVLIKAVKLGISMLTGTGGMIVGGVGAAVADAGVQQITDEILAPLKACGCLAKCIIGIMEAAECMVLYLSMKDQLESAHKAGSLMAPAIDNFVGNQGQQCTYETLNAIWKFVEFSGHVMKSTGIVTAAGIAVQRSAAAASMATDAIYEELGYQQMKAAWKVTRLALEDYKQATKMVAERSKKENSGGEGVVSVNPRNLQNRQLALEAINLNPTLAKYSIAYAAYKQNDPIAREVLAECGLTETMLEQKDAGVRTIQKFLEVKFRNDQILDGTQSFLKGDLVVDWQPKTIELTARCWIATRTRAETKAKPPLKLQKTTEIELALIDLEKSTDDEDIQKALIDLEKATDEVKNSGKQIELLEALDATPKDLLEAKREQVNKHIKAKRDKVNELISMLGMYQPVIQGDAKKGQTDGDPHVEMLDVVLMFIDQAKQLLLECPPLLGQDV